MLVLLIIFGIVNFAALGIGAALMGNPRTNTWYQNAKKAPWTPPNWFFGAAWTIIMICFSVYLSIAANTYSPNELKVFYILFALQFVLNVMWNPVFFRWHKAAPGLAMIIGLEALVAYFTIWGFIHLGLWAGILVLPYLIWLLIAASLNAYVLVKN